MGTTRKSNRDRKALSLLSCLYLSLADECEFAAQAKGLVKPPDSKEAAYFGTDDCAKSNPSLADECEFASQAKGLVKPPESK